MSDVDPIFISQYYNSYTGHEIYLLIYLWDDDTAFNVLE